MLEKYRFPILQNISLNSLTNLYNKTFIEDDFTSICTYIYCNYNTPAKEFFREARGENIVFYGNKP